MCLKAEFLWYTVLSNENGEFYTYSMHPYLNRSVCLWMGWPTYEGLAFVQAGVPSCAPWWWRDAPLVREFQMWDRRCKQWDSHWFQGRKIRFCGIWSTMFAITIRDIFSSTNLYYSYFTRPLLHAVYNTWWLLSLPVDHSRQPVALKWDGGSLGLVSTLFFSAKIFVPRIDKCLFF